MKVAIAGASGLVGRHLMDLLVAESKIESIFSFVRSKGTGQPSKVQEMVVDFNSIMEAKLPPCDVGLCCLGTTIKKAGTKEFFFKVDHDYVVNFAKLCRSSGAKKFIVVSAMGADSNSSVFYNQVKGKMEKALEGLGFESLIILRPSLLLGSRSEVRRGESLAQAILSPFGFLFMGPLAPFKPIEGLTVAKRMIKECVEPEKILKSKSLIILNHQI
jgi:uncharacterized protein YbjT (DUF2867 family)